MTKVKALGFLNEKLFMIILSMEGCFFFFKKKKRLQKCCKLFWLCDDMYVEDAHEILLQEYCFNILK